MARKWYLKAAEQGNALAQFDLGVMYTNGEGMKVDLVQAYKWFSLAGRVTGEDVMKDKSLLEKNMTSNEIEAAQALVRDWQKKHSGYAPAPERRPSSAGVTPREPKWRHSSRRLKTTLVRWHGAARPHGNVRRKNGERASKRPWHAHLKWSKSSSVKTRLHKKRSSRPPSPRRRWAR